MASRKIAGIFLEDPMYVYHIHEMSIIKIIFIDVYFCMYIQASCSLNRIIE